MSQERICALNDAFRSTFEGGRVVVTSGINDHGNTFVARVMAAVRSYADFSEDNDPHGEHDFGDLEMDEQKIFWKIDYYDISLEGGSPDAADPTVTTRVLTIMLASEY